MGGPYLQAEGIRRGFGRQSVLTGIDLEVSEGSLVCLAGPNGCGKTTFLAVCATLLRPEAGRLWVCGLEVPRDREAARRVLGLVAHTSFLYPQLTVRENLAFYAGLYGEPLADVLVLAERFGLEPHLQQRSRMLSRGLLQRATLVRALLHRPRLLLLDEPFTALDPDGVQTLAAALQSHRDAGGSALLTSHDVARDLQWCDGAALMERGRIAWRGTAAEYRAR